MPGQQVTLGVSGSEFKVGEIGYGLMGLTFPNFAPRNTPLSDEDAFKAMKAAIDGGSTFWNGGAFYGFGPKGEAINLELVARFFTKYPELADQVFLSVKGGFNPAKGPDGDPEFLRGDLDRILKALDGKKKLNMYEMARVDQNRPIEEVISTLAGFINEGKFDHIGLSEVSARTIRKAASVHPITTVEVEFSLWSTDIKKNGVLEACNDLGIKIIAYSPLGRGILSGRWEKQEDVPKELVKAYPRYSKENFAENKKFVDMIKQIAGKKNVSPAQVALKWILTEGNGNIIPIPGATTKTRVDENTSAGSVDLGKEELAEINRFVETTEVKGTRYDESHMSMLFA